MRIPKVQNLIAAFLNVAILAACGGNNSGFSSSTPMSVAPQIGAPGAAQQSAGIAAPKSAAAARTMVHRIVPASTYEVLYRFRHGKYPYASLISVNGTLYGTTVGGGGSGCDLFGFAPGCGTVFSVTTTGTEKVLYRFVGGSDGANPYASLINVNGTLYGTTYKGGASDVGTVYSISATGTENVLYSFGGGSDGANPRADLIDVNGTLYGTTVYGGDSGCGRSGSGCGTVYSISTTGAEKMLYSFRGGSDGAYPYAGLIDVSGTLYGTTAGGTVFSVTTTGAEKVLYTFGGGKDGADPLASLINVNGTLYGTTDAGGSERHGVCIGVGGCGTVFSVTTTGTEKVLYRFLGESDGASPASSLIDVNGTLYGTTDRGGGSGCPGGAEGCGTLFSVTTTGTEKVLYSFGGASQDGLFPDASLLSVNGTLYGTTTQGGWARKCFHHYGCGTVFAFTP